MQMLTSANPYTRDPGLGATGIGGTALEGQTGRTLGTGLGGTDRTYPNETTTGTNRKS
jgi:hypothetical protein